MSTSSKPIFISHASADDAFVQELRQTLEDHGLTTWVDSRQLRVGDELTPEIERAIQEARHFIVVLSMDAMNSQWVHKEIQMAKTAQTQRREQGDEHYRLLPILLPGIQHTALQWIFDEEPMALSISGQAGSLLNALPDLMAALGERLPDDHQLPQEIEAQPVEELLLHLTDPVVQLIGQKRRVSATATLVYEPADPTRRPVHSRRFRFTAPLGPIESDELRWYLEEYARWPSGVFQERAAHTEAQLPEWGKQLYAAALAQDAAQESLRAWQQVANGSERRFSVMVDDDLIEGTEPEAQAAAQEAASGLLSLPWELLHDERGYLFQGNPPVRIRRRLPNRFHQAVAVAELPIRILLVSPRPEDDYTDYIDHRVSALPLVEAVENLGELVALTVLTPPTFPALCEVLQQAAQAGQPFDVVHFDGHGIYDRQHGLGGLCFEDPNDRDKVQARAMSLIHADRLANELRDHRIPLFFLEACQSAMIEDDPTASVAARLLEEGVTSVVAMSHTVLVETARRFVQAFYRELAQGARVGRAMLAGQAVLQRDTYRLPIMGAGELHLHDWFVPILYQEQQDPQLFGLIPSQRVQHLQQERRRLRLGALPDAPPHHFQGRSRELLALERLLHRQQWAVIRGPGGMGKTTLAVELARWLVRTHRFGRAAFVSVEQISDVRSVLDSLGQQLLPEGANWSVAQFPDLDQARQPVERALRDSPTLIVLDNLESVLPDSQDNSPPAAVPVDELFNLCQQLLRADPATRLLFTSRERLPAPFAHGPAHVELGALSQDDAVNLVSQVMANQEWTPPATDPGSTPQEISDLVEAVQRHPRALVLLAHEVASSGVRNATHKLAQLMAELERKSPGQRQNSLYASVELSLRRLPAEMQEQIQALGVFHGGAHIVTIMQTLAVDQDSATRIARALIDVGLAQSMDYGYLRLDPALTPYLLTQIDATQAETVRNRWAEAMRQLVDTLYREWFKNAQFASQLILLELANLLALLDWLALHATAEEVINVAGSLEQLFAHLGRSQALAHATHVREEAAQRLGGWSHARFENECQDIERLIEQGELPTAHEGAQSLLKQALAGGESAYAGAAYHIAFAYILLGRVLGRGGQAQAALTHLAQAQARFQSLADDGNSSAARMASVAITEQGDCLTALGRLEEAADAYTEAIERAEELDDKRQVGVNKGQLARVRIPQQRYGEALALYAEARTLFEELDELSSVAVIWHQIGMTYRYAEDYPAAERAYRQALAIAVRQKDRNQEALSLGELGTLYNLMERLEEAVTFDRQAADIYMALQDLIGEGRAHNNLARTLIQLQRWDEARSEVQRAIECKQPYGHAAEPWKTQGILYDLEEATGHAEAAAQARQQAMAYYLAYRRDGGGSHERGAQICALVEQTIQQGNAQAMGQQLVSIINEDTSPQDKVLIAKLQAILGGERNPALAADPALYYQDAVEVQLLLERLGVRLGIEVHRS